MTPSDGNADDANDAASPFGVSRGDLAPGDTRSIGFDPAGLDVHAVTSADHAAFATGYAALWAEFGGKNEMEARGVIERRLAWRPDAPTPGGYALRYAMVVVRRGDTLAAVRDHTAIVDVRRPGRPAVVHLSHLLIAPPWRGSGLAGWMRALPLRTARDVLSEASQAPRPVTLVAEMEPADPAVPGCMGRLIAYEKAGFRKVDPARVNYLQPDFRPPAAIDADPRGPRPVPLSLVLRRVGREGETTIVGSELRAIVESLYAMYGESFRPQDLRPNVASLAAYPKNDATIDLVLPSAVIAH